MCYTWPMNHLLLPIGCMMPKLTEKVVEDEEDAGIGRRKVDNADSKRTSNELEDEWKLRKLHA
jgi:hypothetical protein